MKINYSYETVWMTKHVFHVEAEHKQRHETLESMQQLSAELAGRPLVTWWNVRKL